VVGDKEFRPVGIATAPDGSLYVTDWVLKDYKLHGKGAIWRVRLKDPVKSGRDSHLTITDAESRRKNIANNRAPQTLRGLLELLNDDDPFMQHTAIDQLREQPQILDEVMRAKLRLSMPQRRGIAVAQQRLGVSDRTIARAPDWLIDSDVVIRLLCAKWIADHRLKQFKKNLNDALGQSDLTAELLEGYLAALARIEDGNPGHRKIRDRLRDMAMDPKTPTRVRLMALRRLPPQYAGLKVTHLERLLDDKTAAVRVEAVRSLAIHRDKRRTKILTTILNDNSRGAAMRSWAINASADSAQQIADSLVNLAAGQDGLLSAEALRALVGVELTAAQKKKLRPLPNQPPDVAALARRVLKQKVADERPERDNTDAWASMLDGPANAEPGRRVFFSKAAGCIKCHTMEGRGAKVGPDLTRIGYTANRNAVLESILQPSKLIAPRFYPTKVVTHLGESHIGIFTHREKGVEVYVDATGNTFRYTHRDIAERTAVKLSLMPDNLVNMLTDQELRDLLAFLMEKR
jgi:hypothetical protein